jgi:hypothetical protein
LTQDIRTLFPLRATSAAGASLGSWACRWNPPAESGKLPPDREAFVVHGGCRLIEAPPVFPAAGCFAPDLAGTAESKPRAAA